MHSALACIIRLWLDHEAAKNLYFYMNNNTMTLCDVKVLILMNPPGMIFVLPSASWSMLACFSSFFGF